MKITKINENKKDYFSLLLIADEQKDMINKYLDRGDMYILEDQGVKAECVLTDEGNGILEIKNIATDPKFHGKGYGKKLINFIVSKYKEEY